LGNDEMIIPLVSTIHNIINFITKGRLTMKPEEKLSHLITSAVFHGLYEGKLSEESINVFYNIMCCIDDAGVVVVESSQLENTFKTKAEVDNFLDKVLFSGLLIVYKVDHFTMFAIGPELISFFEEFYDIKQLIYRAVKSNRISMICSRSDFYGIKDRIENIGIAAKELIGRLYDNGGDMDKVMEEDKVIIPSKDTWN